MNRGYEKAAVCLGILAASTGSGGCTLLNPDRQLITHTGPDIHLIEDSSTVQGLLSVQKARDADVDQFWRSRHSEEDATKRICRRDEEP